MKIKDYRIVFCFVLAIVNINTVKSCDCFTLYIDNFCENVTVMETDYNVNYNIVMAEITESLDFNTKRINVLEDLKNEINTNEVEILGGSIGCGEDLDQFSIGDTLIMALLKWDDDDQYFLGGECGLHFLRYSNGNVIGQIAPTVELSSYADFVADSMNCMNLTTSINTMIEGDGIKIYPNPTTNYLLLELNNVIDQIKIFSIGGQEISISNDVMQANKIDLSEFEHGIYIVSVKAGNREYTKRIIKN